MQPISRSEGNENKHACRDRRDALSRTRSSVIFRLRELASGALAKLHARIFRARARAHPQKGEKKETERKGDGNTRV